MMWVPPSAFHGTIGLAASRGIVGAALACTVSNATASKTSVATVFERKFIFMDGLPKGPCVLNLSQAIQVPQLFCGSSVNQPSTKT